MGRLKFLKKDNLAFGAALGALVPVLMFLLLSSVNELSKGDKIKVLFDQNTLYVLSIFTNLLPFRIYMVNLKFDYTGRGILLVTFIYAALFVYQASSSGKLF